MRKDVELHSKAVEHKLMERIAALEVAQAASTAAVKQEVIERSAALDQKLTASTAAVKQEVVRLKWWVICVVVLTVAEGATKLLPLVKLL